MTLFLMCLLGLSPWGGIHVFVGKFHLFTKITKVLFLLLLFCFSFFGKIFYYFFFSSFF